ncbi:MAG: hypothetical protein K5930_02170 [Treponemataceae bacterium]|nr:hypothetical protein [Treponemataceae bacterium]
MSSFFAGGLLILLLQLPIVLRPIFLKKPRIDSIVMFLPFSVIVMGLYLFAFGFQLYSLVLLILVVLIFFTNFRAMLRFKNRLLIDGYSFLFCASSFIEFLLIIGLGLVLVLYCPVADMGLSLNFEAKPEVSVSKSFYTGSAYRGMQEREGFFSPVDAILWTYSPSGENENTDDVILCVGGSCADFSDYSPLLKKLSHEGYTSLIMETSSSDLMFSQEFWNNSFLRSFTMRLFSREDKVRFQKLNEDFYSKKLIEAQILIDIAEDKYPGRNIFLLTDGFPAGMIKSAFPMYKNIPLELKGCGLIALTKPVEAAFVEPVRWGRKNRAESFKLPDRLSAYIKKEMDNVK